jgi:hypothetical protein
VHFFGKGCCKNVLERINEGREKQKGLIAKINMSKEVVLKHPCMTMCRVTN